MSRCCLLLAIALPLCLALRAPGQTDAAAPAPAPRPSPVVAKVADFGADFASNYLTLNSVSWRQGLRLAGRFVGATVLAGLLFLSGGLAFGLLLWALLRRWGALDLPYRWYRYVRWVWAVLFPLSFALGAAYAGGAYGAGRFLERQVRDERVLDDLAWNVANAAVLAALAHRATGRESPAEILALVADAERLDLVIDPAWRTRLDAWLAERSQAWYVGGLRLAGRVWLRENLGVLLRLEGIQPRFLLLRLLPPAERDRYVSKHPEAQATLRAADLGLARGRTEACRLVRHLVWPQIVLGLGVGVGLPLLLLALVQLGAWLGRLAVRAARPASPPSPGA